MKKWLKFGITNLFTALRTIGIVCLIPVFKIYGGIATALLSAGCFATDFIDGFLARKLDSSTFFGSLFDGISDKAFLIVNMILLMTITPLAIIPIIAELGIATVQSLKYEKNLNVKSNMIGKAKMWVAGITVTLAYLLADQNFINYLGADIATKISQLGEIKLFGITLAPLVLSEIATLSSYIKEFVTENKQNKDVENILENNQDTIKDDERNEEKENPEVKETLEESLNDMTLKDMLFDHEFYERHKDEGNLKLIRKMAKKKR